MSQEETNHREWENQENWKGPRWFSIYRSPKDSRLFVPRQIRWMGGTVNLAYATGPVLILIAILFVGVGFAELVHWLGGGQTAATIIGVYTIGLAPIFGWLFPVPFIWPIVAILGGLGLVFTVRHAFRWLIIFLCVLRIVSFLYWEGISVLWLCVLPALIIVFLSLPKVKAHFR